MLQLMVYYIVVLCDFNTQTYFRQFDSCPQNDLFAEVLKYNYSVTVSLIVVFSVDLLLNCYSG